MARPPRHSSLGITDISGIQNLTGVLYVYLGNNSITDLSPLGGLPVIEYLLIGENPLSDLSPLSGLTTLTTLDVQDNLGITDIKALVDNVGIGSGDDVNLNDTSAPCADVDALRARGVTVHSPCP